MIAMEVGWRIRFTHNGTAFEGVVSQIIPDPELPYCRVGLDDGTSTITSLTDRSSITVLDKSGDALDRQIEAMEAMA